MMAFTFFALILLLIAVCFYMKDKALLPVIFSGSLAALLVCAFRTFFLFSHRVIPYSFGENFLYLFIRQAFLPILILYGLFLLISRDSIDFKLNMYLPVTCSFYMIYLPFCIISYSEGLYSAFSLFLKPILFAAMLVQISFSLKEVKRNLEDKKILFVILFIFAAILYMLVPALLESMYLVTTNFIIALICTIVYCAIPAALLTLKAVR